VLAVAVVVCIDRLYRGYRGYRLYRGYIIGVLGR